MNKPNHIVEPEELMAYLDGELPAKQAIDTAAHLESCRECQRLAADFKEVSQMMMGWEVEAVEAELDGRLEAALGSQDRPRPRKSGVKRIFSPRWLWAGGLAATALIILAVSTLSVSTLSVIRKPQKRPMGIAEDRAPAAAQPRDGVGTTRGYFEPRRSGGLVPSATPAATGYDTYGSTRTYDSLRKLEKTEGLLASDGKREQSEAEGNDETRSSKPPANNGPMIVRTAELAVTTKDFERVRSSVEEILKRHHGYVGQMNVNTPTGSARSLTATLRVPVDGLEAVLADLKHLGRAEKESQTGEEVTQQYVDLQARLANAKHTEQRLADILRERTGKLSDVLTVEMQIGRVRGEIEQMEAERKNMKNQVDFATLNVTIAEDYKEELNAVPPSTGTQFRNASVEGYRSLVDGIISVLLWLLSAGPTLLVWAAILFFPARFLWKKLKPKWQSEASQNL